MTNEILFLSIGIIFFHILEMLFTVLYLNLISKKYKKWYSYELNFHRIFLKKYGLIKGALISVTISTFIFILLIYFSMKMLNSVNFLYFIFGMSFMMCYINYTNYRIARKVIKIVILKND